jgi:hypothetical protein
VDFSESVFAALVSSIERNERGVSALPGTLLVPGKWNEGQALCQQ